MVIPKNVREIGAFAFAGNKSIKSVMLGEDVKCIEECAFADCCNLKHVSLSGVTMIRTKAFYTCRNLTNIFIPASVIYIEEDAFDSSDSLRGETVDKNVTITAPKGSYAIKYAEDNGIKYIEK